MPDRRIGHYSSDQVYHVYLDPEGNQYVIEHEDADEDEERVPGTYLRDGETWADDRRFQPVSEEWRPVYFRRAIHEVGHTAACFLAGIKVEWVTIVPKDVRPGVRLGYCQYDYEIESLRAAEPLVWNPRLILAHLGGPIADREYLTRRGLPVEAEYEYQWSVDESRASACLDRLTLDTEGRMELMATADKLLCEQFRVHWPGFEKAAELLLTTGSISGEMARDCFDAIEPVTLGWPSLGSTEGPAAKPAR